MSVLRVILLIAFSCVLFLTTIKGSEDELQTETAHPESIHNTKKDTSTSVDNLESAELSPKTVEPIIDNHQKIDHHAEVTKTPESDTTEPTKSLKATILNWIKETEKSFTKALFERILSFIFDQHLKKNEVSPLMWKLFYKALIKADVKGLKVDVLIHIEVLHFACEYYQAQVKRIKDNAKKKADEEKDKAITNGTVVETAKPAEHTEQQTHENSVLEEIVKLQSDDKVKAALKTAQEKIEKVDADTIKTTVLRLAEEISINYTAMVAEASMEAHMQFVDNYYMAMKKKDIKFDDAQNLKVFELLVACELYAIDKIKEHASDVIVHEANILWTKIKSMEDKLEENHSDYYNQRRVARCNRYNNDPKTNTEFVDRKLDDDEYQDLFAGFYCNFNDIYKYLYMEDYLVKDLKNKQYDKYHDIISRTLFLSLRTWTHRYQSYSENHIERLRDDQDLIEDMVLTGLYLQQTNKLKDHRYPLRDSQEVQDGLKMLETLLKTKLKLSPATQMSLRIVHLRNELIKIQRQADQIKISEEVTEIIQQQDEAPITDGIPAVQGDTLQTKQTDNSKSAENEKDKKSETETPKLVETTPVDAHLLPSNIHTELEDIVRLYHEAEETKTGICDVPQVLLYRLTLYLPPATRSSVPIEIIEAAKQTNELVKRVYDESLKGKDTNDWIHSVAKAINKHRHNDAERNKALHEFLVVVFNWVVIDFLAFTNEWGNVYEATMLEVFMIVRSMEKMKNLPHIILNFKNSRQLQVRLNYFKRDFNKAENMKDNMGLAEETQAFMEFLHEIPAAHGDHHVHEVTKKLEKIETDLIETDSKSFISAAVQSGLLHALTLVTADLHIPLTPKMDLFMKRFERTQKGLDRVTRLSSEKKKLEHNFEMQIMKLFAQATTDQSLLYDFFMDIINMDAVEVRVDGVSSYTKRNILVAVHVLQSKNSETQMGDDVVKLANHTIFKKRLRQFGELVNKDNLKSAQKMAEQAFHTLALLRQHKGNTSHVQTNRAVDELIKEMNKLDTKEFLNPIVQYILHDIDSVLRGDGCQRPSEFPQAIDTAPHDLIEGNVNVKGFKVCYGTHVLSSNDKNFITIVNRAIQVHRVSTEIFTDREAGKKWDELFRRQINRIFTADNDGDFDRDIYHYWILYALHDGDRGENKEIYGHLSLINNVLLKMYGEKKWPEIFQEADDFLKKMNEFTPKADSIDGVSQLKSLLEKLREPQEEHLPAPQIKQPLSKKHASLFKIKQRICIIWGMIIYQIDLMKKDQSAKTVFDQFKEKSYPHDLLIFGIEMQRHREICHKVDRNSDFYIKFAQLGFEELIKYEDIGDEEILEIDRLNRELASSINFSRKYDINKLFKTLQTQMIYLRFEKHTNATKRAMKLIEIRKTHGFKPNNEQTAVISKLSEFMKENADPEEHANTVSENTEGNIEPENIEGSPPSDPSMFSG